MSKGEGGAACAAFPGAAGDTAQSICPSASAASWLAVPDQAVKLAGRRVSDPMRVEMYARVAASLGLRGSVVPWTRAWVRRLVRRSPAV